MASTGLKATTYGAGDSFPFTEVNPSIAAGFCWHCGRDLKGDAYYLVEVVDGGKIRAQDGTEADYSDAGYMGFYEVGRYCGRKFDEAVRVWSTPESREAAERDEVAEATIATLEATVAALEALEEAPAPVPATAPAGSGSQKARCLAVAERIGWTVTSAGKGARLVIIATGPNGGHMTHTAILDKPASDTWKAMRRDLEAVEA